MILNVLHVAGEHTGWRNTSSLGLEFLQIDPVKLLSAKMLGSTVQCILGL